MIIETILIIAIYHNIYITINIELNVLKVFLFLVYFLENAMKNGDLILYLCYYYYFIRIRLFNNIKLNIIKIQNSFIIILKKYFTSMFM